jgi:hypothetical protein
MMDLDKAPKEDLIDEALVEIIDELIGDDGDEEDFDAASDIVFEVIDSLVEQEQIEEIPDLTDEETVKSEWLSRFLPVVKEALMKAMNDGFLGDQSDSDPRL